MSKSKPKVTVIGPADVRAAFHNGDLNMADVKVVRTVKGQTVEKPADTSCLTSGPQGRGRGRVAKPFVEAVIAQREANGERVVYAEKVNVPTITLPVTKVNARGAVLKRPVEVPLTEFRRLSGQAKGRPSKASLTKAAEAYTAEQS